jgi:hypothetical protein
MDREYGDVRDDIDPAVVSRGRGLRGIPNHRFKSVGFTRTRKGLP